MEREIQGKIIKGIAGFYYVYTEKGLIECKAKGIFRKDGVKPLVGDDAVLALTDEEGAKGNITRILSRKNQLIRPACANVDQALVIFAITKPEPNYNLLDRFLITMEKQGIPAVICFNKQDIANEDEKEQSVQIYERSGYQMLCVSGKNQDGIEKIMHCLRGKTTVAAGPSGVGKSTIVNALYPFANMETGEISKKIDRGRHTTRHSQLFALGENTFLMDTPGFTSLSLGEMEKEELSSFYGEFGKYEQKCRFSGCSHISEPDCSVKKALSEGKISPVRYENYRLIYEELKNRRKY